MSRIHRLSLLFSVVLAAGVAGSGMARGNEMLYAPTTVLDGTLTAAPGTYEAGCHLAYRPGRAGVASRSVDVAGPGKVTVELAGHRGDWDVAVFDAAGRAIAADASPDAQEVAVGYAPAAGTLRVQACRRSGGAASVPATLEHAGLRDGALKLAKRNAPKLVSVMTPTRAHKDQLLALGLDMTEHGGSESLGVVLHGPDDEAALLKAGLRWRVLVEDLVAQSHRQRLAESRVPDAVASQFPSGRTTYRTLADYNTELKDLADANPGLVRLFTLPNKTWIGKDVMGIEITTNVNANDGKPAFLNMGVHHAREWPSGEHAMEWAYELINGFKAGDPRATKIVRNSRNLVVPIVNPDGFEASRGSAAAPDEGRDEAVDDTAYLVGGTATGGEYRRKNCRLPDDSEAGNCTTSSGLTENGVDPNRNYGGLWGGPGADPSNPLVQTYRGPGRSPSRRPATSSRSSPVTRW